LLEALESFLAEFLPLLLLISFFFLFVYKISHFLFGDQILHALLFIKRKKLSRMERNGIERLVQKNIPYFKHLSPIGKAKFISRLTNHFVHKNFEGRKGQRITREIKTMISASAVQLTFGLRYSFLNHFDTYIIFPRKFQLTEDYPEMYGATLPNGTVIFSLRKLEEGYADYKDGVNLGIHEFAHALVIQHKVGVLSEMDWHVDYDEWEDFAYKRIKGSNSEKRNHFRRDVVETPTEMFPILVEEFFERPDEFHSVFPGIYMSLVKLLNQNPRRTNFDYTPISIWGR
jgi:Mlc titration factor MtfA (ptsG expression regulator)